MSEQTPLELAPLFAAVEQALTHNRGLLNQADLVNGNHGDHMIAVFHLAAHSADIVGPAGRVVLAESHLSSTTT